MPEGILWVHLPKRIGNGEGVTVRLQRPVELALYHLRISNPSKRQRKNSAPIRVVRIAGEQTLHDLSLLLGRIARAACIADSQQRFGGFIQGGGLAPLEIGRRLTRTQKLILQRAGPIENILDQRGRDAARIAEALRQIEYKIVRGLGRGGQRVFGALALLVGNLPLRQPRPPAAR